MAGKATIVISSDTKDGEKGIQRLVEEMNKLREENKRLADENRKSAAEAKKQAQDQSETNRKWLREVEAQQKAEKSRHNQMTRDHRESMEMAKQKDAAWMRFGGTILTAAGSYLTLNTVLSATNGYLERQKKLQDEIHQRTLSLGNAQSASVLNFAGLSKSDQKAAIGIGARVNQSANFGNQGALERAAGSMISAGATPKESEQILGYAAQIAPGDATLVESLGAGIVDLKTSSGMSATQSSGLLLTAAANSRVKNPTMVSKSLAKVGGNATSLFDGGGKALAAEEGAALWAVITKLRADASGEESATLASNAITKLSTFGGFGPDGPNTIMGRIKALYANPALAKKFIEHGGYLTQDPAVGRLLTDSKFGFAQMLGEADNAIGYDPTLGGTIRDLQKAQPAIGAVQQAGKVATAREMGDAINRQAAAVQQAEEARLAAHDLLDPRSGDHYMAGAWGSMWRGAAGMMGSPAKQVQIRQSEIQAMVASEFGSYGRDGKRLPQIYREEGLKGVEKLLGRGLSTKDEALLDAVTKLVEVTQDSQRILSGIENESRKPTVDPRGMQE